MVDEPNDLQTYVDDILHVLSEKAEKKIEREELEQELRKFLDYGVPLEHAKQSLIKKYGGGGKSVKTPVSTERVLLVDIKPNVSSVHVLCRVIALNEKEVTARGEKRKIFYGILGDESTTVSFTAWKDFTIEKGNVVEISNAYTREWQGATQINLGDRTTVQKLDDEKLPETRYEPRVFKVSELRSGLGSVEVTARILDITEREVEVEGKKKVVFSGTLGDDTGKAQYTSWYDFKLKEGAVVKISGGYVKSWKGVPQLTFDEKAKVEILDAETIAKKDIRVQKLPLHALVEKRGALDVEVEGTIIEVREGSGLVTRCPECNRVLQNKVCETHGEVKGVSDLRIKIVIDDGTGAVNGLLGREVAEELLGKSLSDWEKFSKSTTENDLVIQELHDLLFAHRIVLQGNALGDEYGTTVIAKKATLVPVDVVSEAEKLRGELEGLL